jgi:hypothetical protein
MLLGFIGCFVVSACGSGSEKEQVGVALNWNITSVSLGSVSCLDVEAATVEWTFDPASGDGETLTFTYDCVDSGQSEQFDSGEYQVVAKLKKGDGVVLSQCEPDVDPVLTPETNQVGQCTFEVP